MKNNGLVEITILTTHGPVSFTRTRLIPADAESKQKLLESEGTASIFPMDCALGIDKYPFKMTYKLMAEVAMYGVMCRSYEDASRNFTNTHHFTVSKSQIESVTEYVGSMAFCKQRNEANLARKCLENDKRDNRK